MYLDQLLERIEAADVGCHWGDDFLGCLAYADDLVLLSPTINGLKQMLRTCENFSRETKLAFNPLKSMCMCFRRRKTIVLPNVKLDGETIAWVDKTKHLGAWIQHDLSEQSELSAKRGDLAGRTNVVMSTLRGTGVEVRLKVFQSQCEHMYGCQAWNLLDPNIKTYITMHNRCLRKIMDLPNMTHRSLLPLLRRRPPVQLQLASRVLKFIVNVSSLPSRTGRVACAALSDHSSLLCSNQQAADELMLTPGPSQEECIVAEAVGDLLLRTPGGFSPEDARTFAHYLCVV